MQEGQDRSGDQSPEYMGAWSPIPAGDQPDQPSDSTPPGAGTPGHDTWVVPDDPAQPGLTESAEPSDAGQPGYDQTSPQQPGYSPDTGQGQPGQGAGQAARPARPGTARPGTARLRPTGQPRLRPPARRVRPARLRAAGRRVRPAGPRTAGRRVRPAGVRLRPAGPAVRLPAARLRPARLWPAGLRAGAVEPAAGRRGQLGPARGHHRLRPGTAAPAGSARAGLRRGGRGGRGGWRRHRGGAEPELAEPQLGLLAADPVAAPERGRQRQYHQSQRASRWRTRWSRA